MHAYDSGAAYAGGARKRAARIRRIPAAALALLGVACLGLGMVAPLAAAPPSPAPAIGPAVAKQAPSSQDLAPTPMLPADTAAASNTPAAEAPVADAGRDDVIAFLSQVIGWYRHSETEAQLAREPAEILFLADDRQMGAQVLSLSFEYARARSALGPDAAASTAAPHTSGASGSLNSGGLSTSAGVDLANLEQRRQQAQSEIESVEKQIKTFKDALARARPGERDQLKRKLEGAQGQLDLAQSRMSSITSMIQFETDAATGRETTGGLGQQIDELARSVPQAALESTSSPAAPAGGAPVPASEVQGPMNQAEGLIQLWQKQSALQDSIAMTHELSAAAEKSREPLIAALRRIDQRGLALAAQTGSGDIAAAQQSKQEFDRLTAEHKLVAAAMLPLAKEMVILNLYADNVGRWQQAVARRFSERLRSLIIRAGAIAFLLIAVFVAALMWRRLTFRYVQDIQRRHQLLQLRRIVVSVIVALVLLFSFANELGSLATIMGFAAAGIAVTLQNVILSVAGFFFLSGRFGIKVGDRVEISAITGDVIDVGLFKLTLMELSNSGGGPQPTGRAVVFPNSVIFQPNANFFRQVPGTDFTWNELRVNLTADCDYRLAEKRLTEVVEEVFARYRDRVQRQYHDMAQILNVRIEMPKPQSRLEITPAGFQIVVRYPVQTYSATLTADEVTRRLVDAIRSEPTLELVMHGAPVIRAVVAQGESAQPHAPAGDGGTPSDDKSSAAATTTSVMPIPSKD